MRCRAYHIALTLSLLLAACGTEPADPGPSRAERCDQLAGLVEAHATACDSTCPIACGDVARELCASSSAGEVSLDSCAVELEDLACRDPSPVCNSVFDGEDWR